MSNIYLKLIPFLILATFIAACAKPESKLIGKWTSDKTATVMEFAENGTGVITLKHAGGFPSAVPFNWKIEQKGKFTIQMKAPGDSALRSGTGSVQGNHNLTLEDDPFRKVE